MFHTEIETLCGGGACNQASVLPIDCFYKILKYHNFRSAFKPSLLVHMFFLKLYIDILCLSYYGVFHLIHSVSNLCIKFSHQIHYHLNL